MISLPALGLAALSALTMVLLDGVPGAAGAQQPGIVPPHDRMDTAHRPDRQERVCSGGHARSRWAAGGGYARTAVYGYDDGGWLMSVDGLAVAPSGTLVVFDLPSGRIHLLDPALRPVHQFGRTGGGPGEIAPPMLRRGTSDYFTRNFAAAGDSLLYVFDGRSVQAFRYDGSYVGRPAIDGLDRSPVWGIVALAAAGSALTYAFDDFDIYQRTRGLQSWRVGAGGRPALIHELPVKPPPGGRGSVYPVSNQARPVWTSGSGCVVVGDGSSTWLLAIDLRTGHADTVRLPPHQVPAEPEPNSHAEEQRQLMENFGVEMGEPPLPTALWRWTELRVDPDGHLWVNPWRPSEERSPPFQVLRIDPAGGIHRERVPAFPLAFGPPGAFYALARDPDTDELLVVRYDRSR